MCDTFKTKGPLALQSVNEFHYPAEIEHLLNKLIHDDEVDSRDVTALIEEWRIWTLDRSRSALGMNHPDALVLFGKIALTTNPGMITRLTDDGIELTVWKGVSFPRVTRASEFLLAVIQLETPTKSICRHCAITGVELSVQLSGCFYPIPPNLDHYSERCVHCGLLFTPADIGTIETIDRASSDALTFGHHACILRALNRHNRIAFKDAIVESGFTVYGAIRAKNEYSSESWRGSWWLVDTEDGPLTLGWRKNVITVDYSAIDPHFLPMTTQTHDYGFEHVSNYDELTRQLALFKRHLERKEAKRKADLNYLLNVLSN